MKVTEGWTLIGINGFPVLDAVTEQPEIAEREQECVVVWKHDYDAIIKEVEEYRALKERTKDAWTEGIRKIREGAKK